MQARASFPPVQDIPLEIVFEDEHLMVINKPAGMVVHPSAGHWEEGTLVHALLHHLQRPAIDLTDSALLPDAGMGAHCTAYSGVRQPRGQWGM